MGRVVALVRSIPNFINSIDGIVPRAPFTASSSSTSNINLTTSRNNNNINHINNNINNTSSTNNKQSRTVSASRELRHRAHQVGNLSSPTTLRPYHKAGENYEQATDDRTTSTTPPVRCNGKDRRQSQRRQQRTVTPPAARMVNHGQTGSSSHWAGIVAVEAREKIRRRAR